MPLLTAREHLILFARLRGIPERYVKKVAEWVRDFLKKTKKKFN
jgi:ABC-type multidrug transport system ATPase subunit